MRADSIPDVLVSSANAAGRDDVRLAVALTRELEASLDRSRKALLALDLGGIEYETREQAVLVQEFELALRRRSPPKAPGKLPAGDSLLGSAACAVELDEELRRSANRVLQAVRLQAALLARARSKLRVLGNMLAGPSLTYGPLLARNGALRPAFASRRRV